MRKFICVIIALALLLSAIPFYCSAICEDYADGEIILKYTPPLTLSGYSENRSFSQQLYDIGIDSISPVNCYDNSITLASVNEKEGFYLVKTDEDIKKTCKSLEKIVGVEYAEPNYYLSTLEYSAPTEITSSYDYIDNQHWYFNDVLQIPDAWEEYKTTGQGVTIAVIDVGFNLYAMDFSTNLWDDGYGNHGWNVAENNADLSPVLYVGNQEVKDAYHGTHVASTIGMASNGIGGLGVAFSSELMLIKVAGNDSKMTVDSLVSALYYAANNGADVINMSLGGEKSSAEEDAINYAYSKGCTIISAAGNSGNSCETEPVYPAAFPNVIGVMASDRNKMNELATFSNYGNLYDVAVPGVDILGSTTNSADLVLKKGTSMASPIVAGLAALYISSKGSCTNEQVCNAIRNSSSKYVKKNDSYYDLLDAMSLLSFDGTASQNNGNFIFDSNGGVGITFQTLAVGDTFGELPTPVREGFIFDGWFTSASNGTQIEKDTVYNGDFSTAFAHWHAETYTVTLELNGGNCDIETISLQYNSDYWSLPIPQKSDNYFIGWYTDAQFKNPAKVNELGSYSFRSVKIARNHTVYAKWSSGKDIAVHFKDTLSNQQFDDIYVNYGESYGSLPALQNVNGYTFLGWGYNENSTDYITEESEVIIPYEHTLYAVWKIQSCTVYFDANGGSCSTEAISVRYGQFYPFEQMPVPTLEGKYFVGWYTADGYPALEVRFGKLNFKQVIIPNDHTLYAKWSDGKNITVHFVDNYTNQVFDDNYVNYGENYCVPVPQSVDGYTFIGWSEYGNGTEGFISNDTTVITACEHTLYAIWQYDGFVFNNESNLTFDSEKKLIYGFDLDNLSEEILLNAFKNPNKQVKTIQGTIGTGTEILLIDKDGNTYDTATVIIFGDVNYDGKIDSTDAVITLCISNGLIEADDFVKFAADCNRDNNINESDTQMMSNSGIGIGKVLQKENKITVSSLSDNPVNDSTYSIFSIIINILLKILYAFSK